MIAHLRVAVTAGSSDNGPGAETIRERAVACPVTKFAPKLETDSSVTRSTSGALRIGRGGSEQRPEFAGNVVDFKK
jgi:hypothetical protein